MSLPHLFLCLLLLVILNSAVINTITGAGANTRKNRQRSQNIQHYLPIRSFDTTVHYSSDSGPGSGSRKLGSDKKTINHCSSTARTLIKHGLQMLRRAAARCIAMYSLNCNVTDVGCQYSNHCSVCSLQQKQHKPLFSFHSSLYCGFFAFIH